MKKVILAVAVASVLVGCGRIETGEIGVRTDFNKKIEMEELQPGWYGALLTNVNHYDIREIEISFTDMTPKANDNLILRDLDVSVFYKINPAKVAEMRVKYSGMSAALQGHSAWAPSYFLIERTARGAIYDSVSKFTSLTMHTKRSELEQMILSRAQEDLNHDDPETFTITKVIVRSLATDPALEQSIQDKVRVENEIAAKRQQVELAKAEADRVKVEAEGTARANIIISNSITSNLIDMKKAEALKDCANSNKCTMIIGGATPLMQVK